MNTKAMPIALRASLFVALGWSVASVSLAQTDMQGGDMQGMSSMQTDSAAPATQPAAAAPAVSDANQPAAADPPFRKAFQNAIAKLNLTPDQKTGIKAVLEQAATDAQAMRQEMATLSPGERAQRRREFVRSVLEKLQAQLTPDQVKQFKQALAELRPTSRPALAAAGADGAQNDPRARLQRLRSILDGMDLNEDQKSKIDTMLADARTKALAVPADASDRIAQLEQIRQGIREQLLTILEPDQLQELRSKLPPTPPPPAAQASAATSRPSAIVAAMMARRQAEIRAQQRTEAAQNPIAAATPTGGPIALGQPAPSFRLEALDDSVITSASLHGHVTALVFGSYSSPVFRDRAAGLERLWRKLDDANSDARLFIIYTKEAHPSGGWQVDRNKEDHINIAAPSTEAERRGEARQAKAALHLTIPFFVDTMDDATAAAYGGFPDGAVVINANGTVVATQRWAEPATLERQINEASGKDASALVR